MNFFVRHLKVNRSGVLVMMAMQGLLFLIGFLMVIGINTFINEDQDYATIGSMMALMATIFGGLLRGSGGMHRYRMAISMGQTRLSYMLADPVITAGNCVIGVLFACLLDKFELWVYSILYPGWTMDFDIFDMLKWWHMLIFVVGICIADFCFGALQLKFGAKGFAVVWFPCCFAPMVIINSLEAAREGGTSLLAQIGKGILFLGRLLSPAMWLAVLIVFILVLIVLSVMCYWTAEVRM